MQRQDNDAMSSGAKEAAKDKAGEKLRREEVGEGHPYAKILKAGGYADMVLFPVPKDFPTNDIGAVTVDKGEPPAPPPRTAEPPGRPEMPIMGRQKRYYEGDLGLSQVDGSWAHKLVLAKLQADDGDKIYKLCCKGAFQGSSRPKLGKATSHSSTYAISYPQFRPDDVWVPYKSLREAMSTATVDRPTFEKTFLWFDRMAKRQMGESGGSWVINGVSPYLNNMVLLCVPHLKELTSQERYSPLIFYCEGWLNWRRLVQKVGDTISKRSWREEISWFWEEFQGELPRCAELVSISAAMIAAGLSTVVLEEEMADLASLCRAWPLFEREASRGRGGCFVIREQDARIAKALAFLTFFEMLERTPRRRTEDEHTQRRRGGEPVFSFPRETQKYKMVRDLLVEIALSFSDVQCFEGGPRATWAVVTEILSVEPFSTHPRALSSTEYTHGVGGIITIGSNKLFISARCDRETDKIDAVMALTLIHCGEPSSSQKLWLFQDFVQRRLPIYGWNDNAETKTIELDEVIVNRMRRAARSLFLTKTHPSMAKLSWCDCYQFADSIPAVSNTSVTRWIDLHSDVPDQMKSPNWRGTCHLPMILSELWSRSMVYGVVPVIEVVSGVLKPMTIINAENDDKAVAVMASSVNQRVPSVDSGWRHMALTRSGFEPFRIESTREPERLLTHVFVMIEFLQAGAHQHTRATICEIIGDHVMYVLFDAYVFYRDIGDQMCFMISGEDPDSPGEFYLEPSMQGEEYKMHAKEILEAFHSGRQIVRKGSYVPSKYGGVATSKLDCWVIGPDSKKIEVELPVVGKVNGFTLCKKAKHYSPG